MERKHSVREFFYDLTFDDYDIVQSVPSINIHTRTVRIGTRIVNATFTEQQANELFHFHGIDTEEEMLTFLRTELEKARHDEFVESFNLDRTIISQLRLD